jgi:hypothetical protein
MKDPFVVVSDPPQPENANVQQVAATLGIQAFDARGKLGYALPEPWVVTENEAEAREKAAKLAAANVRCVALRASELASVPDAAEAKEFQLADEGFGWRTANGDGDLLWTEITGAVFYRVTSAKKARPSIVARANADRTKKAADGLRRMARWSLHGGGLMGIVAFRGLNAAAGEISLGGIPRTSVQFEECLELAGSRPEGPLRVLLRRGSLNYEGLGPAKQGSAQLNWAMLQKVIAEKVPGLVVDRRAEKLTPRPALVGGVGIPKLVSDAEEAVKGVLTDPHELLACLVFKQKGIVVV